MGAGTHRKRNLLLFVAASVLAVVFVLSYVPTSGHKSRTYQCAICGERRTKGIEYLLGIPYRRYERAPSRSYITTRYHQLIGLPHQHEWVYIASGESAYTLFGKGRESVGDAHPVRTALLKQALRTIENDYRDSPKEFRQELFQRLIRCKSFDEFYNILDEEKGKPEDAASSAPVEGIDHDEGEGTDR